MLRQGYTRVHEKTKKTDTPFVFEPHSGGYTKTKQNTSFLIKAFFLNRLWQRSQSASLFLVPTLWRVCPRFLFSFVYPWGTVPFSGQTIRLTGFLNHCHSATEELLYYPVSWGSHFFSTFLQYFSFFYIIRPSDRIVIIG